MTDRLSVAASPQAAAAGAVAQVVASLPVSLRHATGATGADGADLVAVAGAPGWEAEAARAVDGGARGVLVVDPVAADTADLAARAAAAGVPVVLDAAWTHNPATSRAAEALAALEDPEALVESRVDAPLDADLDRVLLAQLALVRAAAGPVTSLALVRRGARGYDAVGRLAGGAEVALAAVLSAALPHEASVRVVRPTRAVALRVPAPVAAVPGTVVVSGPDGATLLPTQWETAHRAAWRRLHSLVTTGGAADDLAGFAADVAVARGA